MQITGIDADSVLCVIALRLDRSAMRRWAPDGEIGCAMLSDSVSERGCANQVQGVVTTLPHNELPPRNEVTKQVSGPCCQAG
jgi:hypothetical protein